VAALRLGATGFIIPFMFVFSPSLLMIGTTHTIVLTAVTATAGVVCLAAGFSGYLLHKASAWERALLLAAAIVLIKPGPITDAIGAGLFTIVLVAQLLGARPGPRRT
jgi:TRAP-type uncharacterized transport system fused permease subunit